VKTFVRDAVWSRVPAAPLRARGTSSTRLSKMTVMACWSGETLTANPMVAGARTPLRNPVAAWLEAPPPLEGACARAETQTDRMIRGAMVLLP